MSATQRTRHLLGQLRMPLYLNALLLMVSSALQSILGLPFWALAARLYSPHTVGVSTTILSATGLLATVGQLGLSSVIIRYLPVAYGDSRRFVLACYGISTSFSLLITVGAVASVGLWGPPLAFIQHDPWWIALFVGATVTGIVFQFQDAVLVGLRQTRWVPLENGIFAISRLAFVVVLAHISRHAGVVIASTAPAILLPVVVNAAIFGRFLPRHLAGVKDRRPEWVLADLRRLVVGNFAGSLAEYGSLYLLPIIVTDQIGAQEEAFFYVPWSLMLGLTVLAANMSSSLQVETADGEEMIRNITSSLKVILGILVPAAVAVSLIAHPLLQVFGHSYASRGTWALRWMMLAIIPTGVNSVGLAIARQQHNGRLVATAQIVGAVSLVVIALLLLPAYGVAGAGLAALMSQMLSFGILAQTFQEVVASVRERRRAA